LEKKCDIQLFSCGEAGYIYINKKNKVILQDNAKQNNIQQPWVPDRSTRLHLISLDIPQPALA